MNKRLSNFEILRILAMFMVLVLHYLDKGRILTSLSQPLTVNSTVAYFLECLAIVAVNVYILITGYFMCESDMKVGRLVQILCQVMWYALLIPVVLGLLGQVDLLSFTTYEWLKILFPIHMKQYWFVTSYVLLMLLVPFLNITIRHMNRMQHLVSVVLLLLYQMFPKSVLPLVFTDDDGGYGPIWLVCLYLVAAFIRRYGIGFFSSLKKSLFCYFTGAGISFLSILFVRLIYLKIDAFEERMDFALHYNHIFCLFTSVSLFYAFVHWKPKESFLSRWAVKVAPYTFGVYLLHEHMLVGYNWTRWLHAGPEKYVVVTMLNMIWKCALVLAVGLFLDWLRSLVFRGVGKAFAHTRVPHMIMKLDQCLHGEKVNVDPLEYGWH